MKTVTEPISATAKTATRPGVNIAIDQAALSQHVMRPRHVLGVLTDRGLEAHERASTATTGIAAPLGSITAVLKHLKVQAFTDNLHATLKDVVTGYAMRLQQNGSTIETLEWNWAQTPSDGSIGWTPDRQMHVASVSKLITAIAMTKLLDVKHISYDAHIADYLPAYWHVGANVNLISFRNLMTHTSGFSTAHGDTDYVSMQHAVAAGVSTDVNAPSHIGGYRYENMNFGLCRILIAIISGAVDRHANLPPVEWDIFTISAYASYVHAQVLVPSGSPGATLAHPAGSVLAYSFPPSGNGWDSGNLAAVCGGAGWHVSIDELLRIMSTFRRTDHIMPRAKAQGMLDNGFGIDVIQDTAAGRLYNKNGLWQDGLNRVEQSLAYFLPENMELVVLANSPIGQPAQFFRSVVTNVYLNHLG